MQNRSASTAFHRTLWMVLTLVFALFTAPVFARDACIPPPADLAAWWPLDEGSGTSGVLDIIGNVPARLYGDRNTTPGPLGGALVFDGDGDYAASGDQRLLAFGEGQDFSIFFWIRTQARDGLILDKRNFEVSPQGWQLYLYRGRPGLQLGTGSGPPICSSDPAMACSNYTAPVAVNDGAWHYVAVTVDRDDPRGVRWYLDGVAVGQGQNPTVRNASLASDAGTLIGAGRTRGNVITDFFLGALDEIRVFRRSLGADEVADNYSVAIENRVCKTAQSADCSIVAAPTSVTAGASTSFEVEIDFSNPDPRCEMKVSLESSSDGLLGTQWAKPGSQTFDFSTSLTANDKSHNLCVRGEWSSNCKGESYGEFSCQSCVRVDVELRDVDPPVPAGRWCGRTSAAWTDRIAKANCNYRNEMATSRTSIPGTGKCDLILGNEMNNEIEGEEGDDCVYGFGGNDWIHGDKTGFLGGSGSDEIHGGAGNDQLWGDAKDDRIYGGPGEDWLWGDAGDDELDGGDHRDRIKGDSGADVLRGGAGSDFVKGDSGRDRLLGDAGDDRLCGNSSRDELDGGAGNDECNAGNSFFTHQPVVNCESHVNRSGCTTKAWKAWPEPACPWPRPKVGVYQSQAVCKAVPHFKIRKKRCLKKGRTVWNGYCLNDKGNWYSARKLR